MATVMPGAPGSIFDMSPFNTGADWLDPLLNATYQVKYLEAYSDFAKAQAQQAAIRNTPAPDTQTGTQTVDPRLANWPAEFSGGAVSVSNNTLFLVGAVVLVGVMVVVLN